MTQERRRVATDPIIAQQGLTYAQALPLLLTTEGFLLAVISLATALGAPGRRRVARTPMSPAAIAGLAAGLAVVVSVGALTIWIAMFTGDDWMPFPSIVMAGAILAAIVAQPVIAVMMAMGLRSGD
jgi:protein-S-isoprenylcysteine O-methyltransferase Ste14